MIEDIIYKKLMQKPVNINDRKEAEANCEQVVAPSVNPLEWFADLYRFIPILEGKRVNPAQRYVYSCRKVIGKLIVFGKRFVRRMLKWYIDPIADQQTEFNNAVTPCIGRLTEITNELYLRSEKTAVDHRENATKHQEVNQRINSLCAEIEKMGAKENHKAYQIQKQLDSLTAEIKKMNTESCQIRKEISALESKAEETNAMLQVKAAQLESMEFSLEKVQEIDPTLFETCPTDFFDKKTNSQSGEDAIVAYIMMVLGYKPHEVTYLDLGANHAKRMSNTYQFYRNGAQGVLVEANPELIPELKLLRSRDVIINKCIAESDGEEVEFFVMNGDGLSTKDEHSAQKAIQINQALEIKKKVVMKTISVNAIMQEYFKEVPKLLNIDLEGCEMEILHSIDFDVYRPTVIIVEMIPYSTKLVVGEKKMEILEFLNEKGYAEYAFTGINSVFIDMQKVH